MNTQETIPKADLDCILANFNLGSIKRIKPLETSGNITYIVETTQKKYILRLSPFGFRYRSIKEIQAEIELIEHLTKHAVPSPKPVATKKGDTVVSWKKHYGYLREFNEGKEKVNPTLNEIEKFGEWLGSFHAATEHFKTKNKRVHRWDIQTTKNNFVFDSEIILKSSFPNKKAFLKKFSSELSKFDLPKKLPKGTIHEDLGKRHVFWEKDSIVGVIDFDRAYYGELILDIGQACRGWCFSKDWNTWRTTNFTALLTGYQKKRTLTDTEKKYLFDAIRFGVIERSLSFALRFTNTKDSAHAEYAWKSVTTLLDILDKNKNKIEAIINRAYENGCTTRAFPFL